MPKLKTHRGAAKRFRARANGVKFRRTKRNHILTKKPPKRMLQARAKGQIKACDLNEVKRLLHGS